jgi:hypothetical protein
MMEIRAEDPGAHRILWHDLEAERRAIEPRCRMSQRLRLTGPRRREHHHRLLDGKFRSSRQARACLGSGCNFQRHCAWAVFLGIGFKFADFIQAIHRIQRFLQTQARAHRPDLHRSRARHPRQLERKWRQHNEMVANMTAIIREYGLSHATARRNADPRARRRARRGLGRARLHAASTTIACSNARDVESNSVGLILTSIPFSTQYEYSPNYATSATPTTTRTSSSRWTFLTPELLRVLQPGRIAAIHVKDRVVPGGMTGLGFQTVYPFHATSITTREARLRVHGHEDDRHRRRAREQPDLSLGWTEQCKDGRRWARHAGVPAAVPQAADRCQRAATPTCRS